MLKNYLFAFSVLMVSYPLLGQWNKPTDTNTVVSSLTKNQNNLHLVSDDKGGAIFAWEDNRNNASSQGDIYAQRMNAAGFAKWTVNGVPICTNAAHQQEVNITEDGAGGAIITWEDSRAGNTDIYAQKIDSNGNILWSPNGVVISSKSNRQKNPKIIHDHFGGAIIVWEDSVNFYWDIYAQRINNKGMVRWAANGISICNANNTQANPKIEIDGSGGAIFVWQDKRNNNDYDIYSQHVDSSGALLWKSNGIGLCTAVNTQNNPKIEPDGNGGAIVGWVDKRNGSHYDIYAQRITGNGQILWTADGMTVCSAANNQSAIDIKFLGFNKVVMAWKDARNGDYQIYVQLFDLSGKAIKENNGYLISGGITSANVNASNGKHGAAILTWQDSSATGWDIKAIKMAADGSIPKQESVVCNAPNHQINPGNVSDGRGGCIFGWDDHRNGKDDDIFAHHLDSNLISPQVARVNSLPGTPYLLAYPNPVSASCPNWNLYYPMLHDSPIAIYDAFGRLVASGKTGGDGRYQLDVSGLSNGQYSFILTHEEKGTRHEGKFLIVK